MPNWNTRRGAPVLILTLWVLAGGPPARAQEASRWSPARSLLPDLLAGPRDPVTSASILLVARNPDAHGPGVETELSLGISFPFLLLGGAPDRNPVVLGIEAGAFARFGLQVLQRELIATDWMFAVPIVWHHEHGWIKARFYHSSSHMGDEYSRRFGDPGMNVSRDALEILAFRSSLSAAGFWAGARYGYNVHPQEDRRWVLRAGGQLSPPSRGRPLVPFVATDVEWDQEAGKRPRLEFRVGALLPEVAGRRALRLSIVALNGPSPLGQFRYRPTTQLGISLQGSL